MKQQLSHIDDHALRELMDESKLLLKLANEHFDHERHSDWGRVLTETILLIEGELQNRIENQEALLIEEVTQQVKESMDQDQTQNRTVDSNQSFNEELATSDLNDFQDSKTEYREVKDKLELIREEIDSET
jgi:adenosyl cobinamide kinase/adenosyl cobinamide phosphate guanylyltransferase